MKEKHEFGEREKRTDQKTEIETDDDVVGDGYGGEFEVSEVSREGLSYDQHRIGRYSRQYCGSHNVPKLLRLVPNPRPQTQTLIVF